MIGPRQFLKRVQLKHLPHSVRLVSIRLMLHELLELFRLALLYSLLVLLDDCLVGGLFSLLKNLLLSFAEGMHKDLGIHVVMLDAIQGQAHLLLDQRQGKTFD